MWDKVEMPLAPELAFATTSVWAYQEDAVVGVMPGSFLSPPTLWFEFYTADLALLRKAPKLLTRLQEKLSAPVVYAEVLTENNRAQKFLRYLGFVESGEALGRIIYSRSI